MVQIFSMFKEGFNSDRDIVVLGVAAVNKRSVTDYAEPPLLRNPCVSVIYVEREVFLNCMYIAQAVQLNGCHVISVFYSRAVYVLYVRFVCTYVYIYTYVLYVH